MNDIAEHTAGILQDAHLSDGGCKVRNLIRCFDARLREEFFDTHKVECKVGRIPNLGEKLVHIGRYVR